VGQPVHVHGSYVGDTFWVSGREHEGRDGYWVVDPVLVGGSVLPVVRGWQATPSSGQRGPEPGETVDLVGWLQPPESTGARDEDPGDNVLPQLRVADLAQHFDEDLYGAYVVLRDPGPGSDAGPDNGEGDGLVQADLEQLPDAGRLTALRNLLYAVEWWFFGAFAAFVWWRWVREEAVGSEVAEGRVAEGR
jgi:surfeit locus 1 family protein